MLAGVLDALVGAAGPYRIAASRASSTSIASARFASARLPADTGSGE